MVASRRSSLAGSRCCSRSRDCTLAGGREFVGPSLHLLGASPRCGRVPGRFARPSLRGDGRCVALKFERDSESPHDPACLSSRSEKRWFRALTVLFFLRSPSKKPKMFHAVDRVSTMQIPPRGAVLVSPVSFDGRLQRGRQSCRVSTLERLAHVSLSAPPSASIRAFRCRTFACGRSAESLVGFGSIRCSPFSRGSASSRRGPG